MKVGFIIKDLSSGGAERATVSLANYFCSKGIDTEIITFSDGESFYTLDYGVKHTSAGLGETDHGSFPKRLFGIFKRISALRKIIRRKEFDYIISMSFYITWYAVAAALFTDTRVIGTERSNPYKYKATRINTFLRRLFYHFTDGNIFQTEKAAEFFTKKLKKTDIVIPNAVFNEQVYSLEAPVQRLNIICGAGRLIPSKRFDILIDAFNMIKDKLPGYRLVIFGEGEEREALQRKTDELSLTEKVFLPGASAESVKMINISKVFVLSSDYEGMPNALMEAMAMGVPSISTRCDLGPEEIIKDGENGLLVKTGDASGIAQAILRITEDKELADRLSENGRKLLETNSIEVIAEKWLSFLKTL